LIYINCCSLEKRYNEEACGSIYDNSIHTGARIIIACNTPGCVDIFCHIAFIARKRLVEGCKTATFAAGIPAAAG
jgi:hypothetical protein